MTKREQLIEEVKTWNKAYRLDGEPGLRPDRYRDDMIDHLLELSDADIDLIEDIYDYDYVKDTV